jgi:transcription elongation factor Elf1
VVTRRPRDTVKPFDCPGCGRQRDRVGTVGIGRFFGGTHIYTLCRACAVQMRTDAEPILNHVELSLAPTQGRA